MSSVGPGINREGSFVLEGEDDGEGEGEDDDDEDLEYPLSNVSSLESVPAGLKEATLAAEVQEQERRTPPRAASPVSPRMSRSPSPSLVDEAGSPRGTVSSLSSSDEDEDVGGGGGDGGGDGSDSGPRWARTPRTPRRAEVAGSPASVSSMESWGTPSGPSPPRTPRGTPPGRSLSGRPLAGVVTGPPPADPSRPAPLIAPGGLAARLMSGRGRPPAPESPPATPNRFGRPPPRMPGIPSASLLNPPRGGSPRAAAAAGAWQPHDRSA